MTRVYEGRRVKVEVFSLLLPNGRGMKAERVLFPPVVSVLPVVGGSVVLLRQFRPTLGVYHLEIPSGVVEEGEAPEAAAARELEEEAGLKATRLELLFEGVVSPGYSTEYSYIFLAEDPERARPRQEEYEVIETLEIPLSEAFEMLRSGHIRDMRTALALSLYFMKKNSDSLSRRL
jgi:ADP-ribose pyrophosphatase